MKRTALVLALAATLALAGCLGGGGDGAEASSTSPQNDQQQDLQEGNDTAANETQDEPAFVWNRTTREGAVTGASLGPFGFTMDGATENWTVAQGARNLTLNLTTQSNEASMRIAPPGCPGTFDDSCSTTVTTENGEATWSTDEPDAGQWHADFFRDSNGYGEVQYTLAIHILQPNPEAS